MKDDKKVTPYPPLIVSSYHGYVLLFHNIEGLDGTIKLLQNLSEKAKAGELGDAPYMWGINTPRDEAQAEQTRKWWDEYTDFLKGRLRK